jgi:FkbM family methyltransferase
MIRKNLRSLIQSIGWDLHRLTSFSNPSAQLLAALKQARVNIVFDIGANVGQFSSDLFSVGFAGKVISFEPLAEAHAQLCSSAKPNSNWFVNPRTAVGDRDGETVINVAGNSVSSSILPMLNEHSSAAPASAYTASQITSLIRLDSVASQYLNEDSRLFIKVDTQGFEWQVLGGAPETLKQAQGVLLELSLVPLYEGQHLWLETIARIEAEGFTLWSLQQGFTDPRSGRTLQVDAIFLRQ